MTTPYTGTDLVQPADMAAVQGTSTTPGTFYDWGGGGGATVTYLMRGYGAVSAAQVYWTSATPDDADAPEAVSNVSIVKIL